MFALYLKEIRSFLSSLIGYIVIVVFLIVVGLFLWVFSTDFNILDYGYANVDGLIHHSTVCIPFFGPRCYDAFIFRRAEIRYHGIAFYQAADRYADHFRKIPGRIDADCIFNYPNNCVFCFSMVPWITAG